MTGRAGFGALSASRRAVMRAIPLILGGLAIGRGWAAAGASDDIGPVEAAADAAESGPAFPLATKPGKRYLVQANGKPFLIHGDTAWSLIVQLTREDVDLYLDDRRARGFNTILVSLIDRAYSVSPPANAYGEQPFLEPDNYAKPNEAYFAHADWVLRRAAEKGFLVLLTPSYVGCCQDGWHAAMIANGPDRLRQYGRYLGRRYRDFTNILWVHSGDSNIPEKELVGAIAEGIRELDPHALHTAHGLQTAARDYWPNESWLQVNNVYTYGPVHGPTLAQYARPERMPLFLIESAYENEHGATEQRLRTQAYQAILCGASGQIFGNNPIWHFDSRSGWPAPVPWRQALGSRGAESMTHLRNLMLGLPWWKLAPDMDNALLIGGSGSEDARAVASVAVDRSFALLYLPSNREITVDLSQLAGREVVARWYDPADGRFFHARESPLRVAGPRRLRPEAATNSAGFEDWVLLLEALS